MFGEMSRDDIKALQELKEEIANKSGLYRKMSICEFQEKVQEGTVNDDFGIAQIVIKNEVRPEFLVSIDRRLVLKTGQIVSFCGLLKLYDEEDIEINYVPKSMLYYA